MSDAIITDMPLPENIDSDDVLREGTAAEYKQGMEMFFNQLVRLNLNMEIIERILDFPADLFGVGLGASASFLATTVLNTFEASILIITKVAQDNSGSDVQTLTRFKNRIGSQLVKPEYQRAFWRKLEVARFDTETQDLLSKALALRNKDIAHLIPDPNLRRLTLADVKTLRDRLNLLFQSLAFNTQYVFLPLNYGSFGAGQSDLDYILDSIAKNSKPLNYPEQNPEWWPSMRVSMSPGELKQLNKYRRKFDLTEA